MLKPMIASLQPPYHSDLQHSQFVNCRNNGTDPVLPSYPIEESSYSQPDVAFFL
jgi:hypothetical protein